MTTVDTGTDTLKAEITDGVGVIELNRPDRRNALHAEMYDALPLLLERYEKDDEVGCVLLTAAGSAFCAGGDIQGGAGQGGRDLGADAGFILQLHDSSKVSIASLPGAAAGAGVGIALAADLRIAAASAKLVTSYINLAFSGDFATTWFLTRMLGPSKALEVMLESPRIDAETARDLGLFNRVVPDDELRGAAMDWARLIAGGPRTAHALIKENLREAQSMPLAEFIPREAARMAESAQTDDHRQARQRWLDEMNERRARSGS